LFLDEIGDMAPSIQASLLRFLESGELRKIGSDRSQTVDVRVVAATNRDLGQLVGEGKFRAEILDRLNVFRVHVPALRERKADIELLTGFFMKTACAESGRRERLVDSSICNACVEAAGAACVCESLFQTLGEHPFPGNVRELRNVVFRLAALTPDDEIQGAHAKRHLEQDVNASTAASTDEDPALDATVRRHIEKILGEQDYNKSAAARVLGIPLTTLINKMKRLGIS
ncbi:MAG: sigma 54-interacting transcriptional regulator, partial [Acidobacteriota bacterium]